ncbi:peptidoglycan editing factor PgeF [Candidatus Daviesbacteria bacterium]|nr:peptidoglycan editing factor PgeF [Candidatus Daviesbacteria bacterium]
MIFKNFSNLIYAVSTISDANMSFKTGPKEEVLANRQRFAQKIGIEPNFISVHQVHGNKVLVVSNNDLGKSEKEADAIITKEPNIFLLIGSADCLAISFSDPKNKTIGLSHAGWRGLDKKIIKQTIFKMKQHFKTDPRDLIIEISPSIGPCHYGNLSLKNKKSWEKYFSKDADNSKGLDLWQAAKDQLTKEGVPDKNIANLKVCTFDNKNYFSNRRSNLTKEPDSRFATILGVK